MTWIVLVTGSQKWTDYRRIEVALDEEYRKHPDMVVRQRHGDAKNGADRMARRWCEGHGVPQDPCPAPWSVMGKTAGFARNTYMVDKDPRPDACHAFHRANSPGTRDCVKKARSRGIHISQHKAA